VNNKRNQNTFLNWSFEPGKQPQLLRMSGAFTYSQSDVRYVFTSSFDAFTGSFSGSVKSIGDARYVFTSSLADQTIKTGATEIMTWKTTGYVGVGTTVPKSKLAVVIPTAELLAAVPALGSPSTNFTVTNENAYGLNFGVLSSGKTYIQSARVDTTATAYSLQIQPVGGYVGIGVDPSYPLHLKCNIASNAFTIDNAGNNAANSGIYIIAGLNDGTGQTYYLYGADGDGTAVGYVENNAGTFKITDVSDERLKEAIGPTKVKGLDIIKALQVSEFVRKKSKCHIKAGFIAQQVQTVCMEAVSTGKDGMFGVSQTSFIPYLVKAVQEQQVIIDNLESRISLLESAVKK